MSKIIFSLFMLIVIVQDRLVDLTNIAAIGYIDEAFVVMCMIIAIIKLIYSKTIPKYLLQLFILLFAFIVSGIASCIINSDFITKNLILSCFLSTKFLILTISLNVIDVKKYIVSKFLDALFWIEKIVLVFAVFNLILPEYYQVLFPNNYSVLRFGFRPICSIFNHPGNYGWFMLLCAIAHYAVYIRTKNKKQKYWAVIAVLASLLSLRTKVVTGIVICVIYYYLFCDFDAIKLKLKKIIMALIFIIVFMFIFRDMIYSTYTLYYTDASGYSVRQALMDNSLKIMKDYFPLGVGFGKYGTWYAGKFYSEYYYKYKMNHMYGITTDNTSYSTDTFWPAIFGETGIVGTVFYIAILLVILKELNRNYKNGVNRTLSLVALLSYIQLIVESFGAASFNSPPQYLFVATIVGISLSLSRDEYRKNKGEVNYAAERRSCCLCKFFIIE